MHGPSSERDIRQRLCPGQCPVLLGFSAVQGFGVPAPCIVFNPPGKEGALKAADLRGRSEINGLQARSPPAGILWSVGQPHLAQTRCLDIDYVGRAIWFRLK